MSRSYAARSICTTESRIRPMLKDCRATISSAVARTASSLNTWLPAAARPAYFGGYDVFVTSSSRTGHTSSVLPIFSTTTADISYPAACSVSR